MPVGLCNGARDGNRTRINSLEGCGNSHYTTRAGFLRDYYINANFFFKLYRLIASMSENVYYVRENDNITYACLEDK